MFNKVIFVGNLTRDPELRYTPQGTAVATMGIAVTSKTKEGEEWKDETLFINVVVFGRQAENCGEFLSKGQGIIVDGRLKERRWEADGQKKSKFEVIAQSVKFLPKRGGQPQHDDQMVDTMPPGETTDLEPF